MRLTARGVEQPSINDHFFRASTIVHELKQAAPNMQLATGDRFSELHRLRREALLTLQQLEHYHKSGRTPVTLEHAPSLQTASDLAIPEHSGWEHLIEELKNSPFVRDNGNAVLALRAVDVSLADRLGIKVMNACASIQIYSLKNPHKAIAIGVGVIIAKLLFVALCWEAMVKAAKKLMGIDSPSATKPKQLVLNNQSLANTLALNSAPPSN